MHEYNHEGLLFRQPVCFDCLPPHQADCAWDPLHRNPLPCTCSARLELLGHARGCQCWQCAAATQQKRRRKRSKG